jgi:hypothetical protein
VVTGVLGIIFGNSGVVREVVPGSPVQTVTVTATGPATSVPQPNTEAVKPLRSGLVTLSEGYSADLDSELQNWDVIAGCGGSCDLWLQDGLHPGYGGAIAPVTSTEPSSVDTCAGATAYEPVIDERRLKKGFRVCIKTTESNFALAQIVKTKTDADGQLTQLSFEITVWPRPE